MGDVILLLDDRDRRGVKVLAGAVTTHPQLAAQTRLHIPLRTTSQKVLLLDFNYTRLQAGLHEVLYTFEKVLVHLLAVLLWDQHLDWGRSLSASAQGRLDSRWTFLEGNLRCGPPKGAHICCTNHPSGICQSTHAQPPSCLLLHHHCSRSKFTQEELADIPGSLQQSLPKTE